jgi:predicted branched-subunit amino acid permease
VAMWTGRLRYGLNIALATTLTNLVVGGLISFYAVQLAALSSTVIGLVLLGLIIDQRIRLESVSVAAGIDDSGDVDDSAE